MNLSVKALRGLAAFLISSTWLVSPPAFATSFDRQMVRACAAQSGKPPKVAGIAVVTMEGASGDLPFAEMTDQITGDKVRIYFDPDLRDVALDRAACFGGLFRLLRPIIPDLRGPVIWSPIVLTRDRAYTPPRSKGERRWSPPSFSGHWDDAADTFLLSLMPHEETHLSQEAQHPSPLPRWFAEGHAEWAGLQVTRQLRPALAANVQHNRERDGANLADPHLASWGGMRVKAGAIERQLSPADRDRLKHDPTFHPVGPFKINPDDLEEDGSNIPGRYGAALALFQGLEERHGKVALRAWIAAVLRERDGKRILPLAQEMLGEDLTPLLK